LTPIRLHLLDTRPTDRFPKPGEMWPLPESETQFKGSPSYRRDWLSKRRPLIVKLPDESEFNLDAARNEPLKVTGEGDNITVEGDLIGRTGRRYRIENGNLSEAGK
jgi:hypothetical protein